MALFITSDSSEGYFKYAREYYRMFPEEPLANGSSVRINSTLFLKPDFWTLQGLTWHMATCGHKEIVLVVHGMFDKDDHIVGLSLPLTTHDRDRDGKPKVGVVREVTAKLLQLLDGDPYSTLTPPDPRFTQMDKDLGLHPGTMFDLFCNMVQLRYAEVNRVEIRACGLGLNEGVLEDLGKCFGCTFISAPDNDNGYQSFPPGLMTR